VVTAAFVTAARADDVPTLDTRRTRDPIGGDVSLRIDTERCFQTEQEARDQLTRQWVDFPAADRTLCTQTATMGGTASYVELIACLQMKRDVAKLRPDRGLTTRPSALPTKQSARKPQARSRRASLTCDFHCDMLSAMIFTDVMATWLSCA
jgi:hypothetical protein